MWFSEIQEKAVNDVCALLEKSGLLYWVDSGSLLAIIRDKYIAEKEDFDLSVVFERDKVTKLENLLSKSEYSYQCSFFDNDLCKIKVKLQGCIPIGIMFFRRMNGFYISPQRYHSTFFRKHISPITTFFHGLLGTKKIIPGRNRDNFLISTSKIYNIGSWMLPVGLIGNIYYCEEIGFNVPEYKEKYLAHRYGEWRRPNSNKWIFSRDDGAFSRLPPAAIDSIGIPALDFLVFNQP